MKLQPNPNRQRFFDYSVHTQGVKDFLSGENEKKVMKALESQGYKLDIDYVRQHPIGDRFVMDFAFIKERVAVEVDGDRHRNKKQRKIDVARDRFFRVNGWVTIRLPERKFFGQEGLFYRYLIREVVEERRKQWQEGRLHHIDIEDYVKEDYE